MAKITFARTETPPIGEWDSKRRVFENMSRCGIFSGVTTLEVCEGDEPIAYCFVKHSVHKKVSLEIHLEWHEDKRSKERIISVLGAFVDQYNPGHAFALSVFSLYLYEDEYRDVLLACNTHGLAHGMTAPDDKVMCAPRDRWGMDVWFYNQPILDKRQQVAQQPHWKTVLEWCFGPQSV